MHGNDLLLIYEFNAYPGFFYIVGKSMYLRCLYQHPLGWCLRHRPLPASWPDKSSS
ncbi:hypothetical protein BDW69DRAFT_163013, partial [Aspergillus filifer]